MNDYKLHWRGSEHYFIFIDCILDPKYYGRFDYRALVFKDTDAVFLTARGMKAQKSFGKKLLDDEFVKQISKDIKSAILDMKNTAILKQLKKKILSSNDIIRNGRKN